MKKFVFVVILGVFVIGTLLFVRRPSDESRSVNSSEKAKEAFPVDTTPSKETALSQATDTENFMSWMLEPPLDPDELQALATANGLSSEKQLLGNPKSGQRVELRIRGDASLIAVYDVLPDLNYQLAAIRTTFGPSVSMDTLKAKLKSRVPQSIEHEDDEAVVFTSDDQGFVTWLGRTADGQLKIAREFVGHVHQNN